MWRRVASLSSTISSSRSSSLYKAAYKFNIWESFTTDLYPQATGERFTKEKAPFITFVLGGPGSGKGTQCAKIVENFGFIHLSAGDLLRREIASHGEYGTMILNTIKDGKIVPSEVTVKLIQKEMESSENHKFLIDGFPRTEENRVAFERIVGAEPNFVLFFDCPEKEMVKRVLNRNEGRVDDNIETIKKRLKVFTSLNLPVINYYSKKGKLYKINAVGSVDQIFKQQVHPLFSAHEVPFLGINCLSFCLFVSGRITPSDLMLQGKHRTVIWMCETDIIHGAYQMVIIRIPSFAASKLIFGLAPWFMQVDSLGLEVYKRSKVLFCS